MILLARVPPEARLPGRSAQLVDHPYKRRSYHLLLSPQQMVSLHCWPPVGNHPVKAASRQIVVAEDTESDSMASSAPPRGCDVAVTHGGRELRYPQLDQPGWLAAQLRARRSLADIAAEIGCATATVRRAIRSQNITDRRRLHEVRFSLLHDPGWLRRRYIDDGRNATELAVEIGCRPPTVLKALHRHGIDVRPGRPRRRYPQLHDPAWLRHRHHHERLSRSLLK